MSRKFRIIFSCTRLQTPAANVNENCALLGVYAAQSGNSLLTFRDNLSLKFSRVFCLTVEDVTDRLSRYFSTELPLYATKNPGRQVFPLFHFLQNQAYLIVEGGNFQHVKGKGEAVPLQARSGPKGSRKLRFPDFMTTAQHGGKVSLKHRPPLPPENTPGTHFCQRLSRPQGHSATIRIMSLKNFHDTIGNRTRDLPVCSVVP